MRVAASVMTFCGFVCLSGVLAVADDAMTAEQLLEKGEQIYRSTCADCHGSHGEGDASAYEKPLVGDLSIGQLADIVSETMPEGEPEVCVAEDAQAVATYMHQAFYSEAAQVRNRPPRIGLARLTADQLRQSLSDLYAQFEGLPKPDLPTGLKAEYFDGKRRSNEARKMERVDPELNFDFGRESPVEGVNADEFLIYWHGGIRVEETGRYEIIVRSTCSFVCNFGRYDREFINNHVQSGDKIEFRRTIQLTAGRVYPFDLQLVQRNRKTEIPPARVSLSWVPPGGVEQIIPARHLVSERVPAAYALQAELPPDDRSYGFERGIAINRQWDESTTAAALEFAQVAEDELWPNYRRRFRGDKEEPRAALRSFLTRIVETAFRAPLSEDIKKMYVDMQIEKESDDAQAIKRVVLLALKSPRFLYPGLDGNEASSRATAARLALVLYDSLPVSDALVRAAERDELRKADQIRGFVTAHIDDLRVKAKAREMFHEWLNMSHFGEITKDEAKFPGFGQELVSGLRESLDLFLDEVAWGESSDYRDLFRADWRFSNERLAEYYGAAWQPASPGSGLRKTASAESLKFGLLTHPYLMSGLAYHDSTSPIHRGVFLIRYLLGRTLMPPQEAFSPLSPDLHPDLTTRERIALQTSPESCQVCHARINGLGFALENYDAAGRYRDQENGKPIDSAGQYINRAGEQVEFAGPAELADFLCNSDDAHRAFVSRAFQHFVKQPPAAFGVDTLDELTDKFKKSQFSIRQLLIEIAMVAAQPPTSAPNTATASNN